MQKLTVSTDAFVSARKLLQERFNDLSPLISAGKLHDKDLQRSLSYGGADFADESLGYGSDWILQTTLICTALAACRGNIHMQSFRANMPKHARTINTLEEQEEFLESFLNDFAKMSFAPMPSNIIEAIKIVAFSERPPKREIRVQIPTEEARIHINDVVPAIDYRLYQEDMVTV